MTCLELLIVFLVLVFTVIYLFCWYRYSHWKNKGVPYNPPKFPYGNLEGFGEKYTLWDVINRGYSKFKNESPFYGIYFLMRPVAVITDLELIKNVLIKDFKYFSDRGLFTSKKDDPLTTHMFSTDGPQWRYLRNKLTPAFTSGKMKFMFPTILKVGHEFADTLSQMIKENSLVEIREILARYTIDIIGTCAFGIECNSLKDPNAEFLIRGKEIFAKKMVGPMVQAFLQTYPQFARTFRMKRLPKNVTKFFLKVVRETVELREKHNIRRNDFMDILIHIKNNNKEQKSASIEELAAEVFMFFLSGYNTSSLALCFSLYEIAQNQNIQDKMRKEINEVLQKHNGEFTYEAMMDMTYMDQVINESLRKNPAVPLFNRSTTENYTVPGTKLVIDKNTRVFIPVYAIHNDPDYFSNPEVFDPDRFSDENSKNRHPFTFLPFGDGPRSCIALRFGRMQMRVCYVNLLKNFRLLTCEATQIPLKLNPSSLNPAPKDGIYLKVEKL